ncbi:hypothetical protein UB31_30615 [Bradyrhizobium sp. LTSP849]|nr:hypothetical protein UP06_36160 [Bradyrhizobium sp. LTSP857]KJC39746.1 hypothetical protein UB31_30615 [Bradyrhizobium sp. LTSP849]
MAAINFRSGGIFARAWAGKRRVEGGARQPRAMLRCYGSVVLKIMERTQLDAYWDRAKPAEKHG